MKQGSAVLRVLQVHTRYRQPSGEDRVVEAERQLLEQAGISVRQVIFDNADLREGRSLTGDLRVAAATVWSRSAERRVSEALRDHGSQVMHVHNTFAAASPSVYRAAARHGVPVVQTLHNYRLMCPAGTAFRNGRPCTDCLRRTIPWPAVAHRCYRASWAHSTVAASVLSFHRWLGTFSRIDALVALTGFQRDLLIAGGFDPGRLWVVPNFLEPDPGVALEPRANFLYAGRLSDEKGISVLLEAAALVPGLIAVAGGGPLSPLVEQAATAGHLNYLGALSHDSVLAELRRATAMVVPSIWFEGFPLVVLEAYATGTPVIASRVGSLAEIIEDGVTGLLVEAGDAGALANGLRWARDHPDELRRMGAAARRRYEERYRGAPHLAALLDVYRAISPREVRSQFR